MSNDDETWKEEYISYLKESLCFFSNKEKLAREKWVVGRLLSALGIDFTEVDMSGAAEPADVSFENAHFQVKEVYDENRRRTDEYKEKLERVKSAKSLLDLKEQYTPLSISFTDVVRHCENYAIKLIEENKYGVREVGDIDLLCYFNWVNHNITAPTNIPYITTSFRSLSVVSNRYCAVIHASEKAPNFLKDSVGIPLEYIEM